MLKNKKTIGHNPVNTGKERGSASIPVTPNIWINFPLDLIWYGHFLVPMKCTGHSGCFSRGKASSHNTALASCFSLCTMFLCFHITGYDRSLVFYGIVNVRAHYFACLPYTRRGVRYKQGRTEKKTKYLSSLCPARGSNPGSPDLNSDSATTDLRPHSTGPLQIDPLF